MTSLRIVPSSSSMYEPMLSRQRRALVACATQAPSAGLVVSDVTVVSPERTVPLEHAYVRILRKFLRRGETQ
jgi:hypothetical protein